MSGLIVDSFAGGGGVSCAIEAALGRSPDIAINHSALAIAMHEANHPQSRHIRENIFSVCPIKATGGRPVELAWFSPDCTDHSKAKGGKPRKKSIRGMAWIVQRWARTVRPRVMIIENVEEFADWGRLDRYGNPDPDARGKTFNFWLESLRQSGYEVDFWELRACDYGDPTIRKRLFIVARCDGLPINKPEPTHGPGREHPYRTAAEIIDWSLPCPSIFERKKPLVEATQARIARGLKRFVFDAAHPFIVPVTHQGDTRVHDINEPLRTVTTAKRGELALCTPYMVPRYGERDGQAPRTRSVEDPLATVVATDNGSQLVAPILSRQFGRSTGQGMDAPAPTVTAGGSGKSALVAAFLAKHYGGMTGCPIDTPLPTTTMKGSQNQLVLAHMTNFRGSNKGGGPSDDPTRPLPAITAEGQHVAEVRAFLLKYYGTASGQDLKDPLHSATSRARFGLVMVHGEPWQLVDIGMRMLTPRELFRAHSFPDDYIIDPLFEGRTLSKTHQVAMVGNSVPRCLAEAVIRAQLPDLAVARKAA